MEILGVQLSIPDRNRRSPLVTRVASIRVETKLFPHGLRPTEMCPRSKRKLPLPRPPGPFALREKRHAHKVYSPRKDPLMYKSVTVVQRVTCNFSAIDEVVSFRWLPL